MSVSKSPSKASPKSESKSAPHFKTVLQVDVPHSRKGKHNAIVTKILSDLESLKDGAAIRIPVDDLEDTVANIRSALNRATRQKGITIATARDDGHLYIWNSAKEAKKK